MSSCPPGASERAQRQLFRALRYHALQDPQLHNTLKDMLASVSASGKGLSTAARIYLARRVRLQPDFLALVEGQYGVRPKTLTVGNRDVKDVSDWVAQQTNRKVLRFMATSFPRSPGVNTVSAAHFKGGCDRRLRQRSEAAAATAVGFLIDDFSRSHFLRTFLHLGGFEARKRALN